MRKELTKDVRLSPSSALPLLFWLASFTVGSFAKGFAIGVPQIWYDLPPDLSLWAAGMAVAHLISVRESGGARTIPVITHNHGPVASVTMTYETQLPTDPRPSIGSMWGPIFAVLGWFFCLELTQFAYAALAHGTNAFVGTAALALSIVVSLLVALLAVWLTSSVTTARRPETVASPDAIPDDESTVSVEASSTQIEDVP